MRIIQRYRPLSSYLLLTAIVLTIGYNMLIRTTLYGNLPACQGFAQPLNGVHISSLSSHLSSSFPSSLGIYPQSGRASFYQPGYLCVIHQYPPGPLSCPDVSDRRPDVVSPVSPVLCDSGTPAPVDPVWPDPRFPEVEPPCFLC